MNIKYTSSVIFQMRTPQKHLLNKFNALPNMNQADSNWLKNFMRTAEDMLQRPSSRGLMLFAFQTKNSSSSWRTRARRPKLRSRPLGPRWSTIVLPRSISSRVTRRRTTATWATVLWGRPSRTFRYSKPKPNLGPLYISADCKYNILDMVLISSDVCT